MNNPILVTECNFHLGDNPSAYLSSTYIGLKLALPMKKTWISDTEEEVSIIFKTESVQTWGDWEGHKVFINNDLIGRLKDPSDQQQGTETFEIILGKTEFEYLLGGANNFELQVHLETQKGAPGMADDFLLKGIYTKNLSIQVG